MKKGNNPLGFSIVGGSDHASHPFGMDEPGIFISKVLCWTAPEHVFAGSLEVCLVCAMLGFLIGNFVSLLQFSRLFQMELQLRHILESEIEC